MIPAIMELTTGEVQCQRLGDFDINYDPNNDNDSFPLMTA